MSDVTVDTVAHIHVECADRTCPILFSWDALFYHTFFVSLYLLVFRLFFTFLFAFVFLQQWHVEKVWGWFPIVAFNSDVETFTKMNSFAIIATSILVFSLYIFQVFARYDSQREYKVYAWFLGVVMLLVQYTILIYINALIQFSVSTNLWIIFFGMIIFAAFLLYVWAKSIRLIRFRQFYKREEKKYNDNKSSNTQ